MSNSNGDRRSSQQNEGEKGSKGQDQQGGHQSHTDVQQGGKDYKGGQSRQGAMDDDDEQGTGPGTQRPNKNSNPGNFNDHETRKGGRSE